MDVIQLAHFRQLLLEMKRDIEQRKKPRYNLSEEMLESLRELSLYDNHPADIGTELFEREKDLALVGLDEETLREIDQALENIANGTYGICTVCGEPIPEERLEALPQSMTCKEHAPTQHINQQRPVEEEVLFPPFARTDLDEHEDNNFFDGEDAWQIVESYGSSSTPQSYTDQDKMDYDEMYIESNEPDTVQPVEDLGYTDITGYHGPDSVQFMRGGLYDNYMNRHEGKGNFIDYEDYLKERAEGEVTDNQI